MKNSVPSYVIVLACLITIFIAVTLLPRLESATSSPTSTWQRSSTPSVILTWQKDGVADLIKTFEVNESLSGHLLMSSKGEPAIAYGIGNGQILIGNLFDSDGVNLSAIHRDVVMQGIIPSARIDQSAMAPYVSRLDNRVLWGSEQAPKIIMFNEPYCGYCKQAIKALLPMVESGMVSVEIVPVAFLSEQSVQQASAILEKGASVAVMMADGVYVDEAVVPQKEIIDDNLAWMYAAGRDGTPAFLFEKNGSLVLYSGNTDADGLASLVSSLKK